jgi:hypothetical protein
VIHLGSQLVDPADSPAANAAVEHFDMGRVVLLKDAEQSAFDDGVWERV